MADTDDKKTQKGSSLSFWLDMIGILLLLFGLSMATVNAANPDILPTLLYLFGINFTIVSLSLILACLGIIILLFNWFIHSKKRNQEEQVIEKEIGDDRMHIFYYSVFYFSVLLLIAGVYIYTNYSYLTTVKDINWMHRIMISIWFAMLGTATISFKGISEHSSKDYKDSKGSKITKWDTNQWGLWHIERPFNGIIVGIMTYFILQVLNKVLATDAQAQVAIPTLAVAAFIFGLQEQKFYEFLEKAGAVVLATKNEKDEKKEEEDEKKRIKEIVKDLQQNSPGNK